MALQVWQLQNSVFSEMANYLSFSLLPALSFSLLPAPESEVGQ